MLMFQAVPFDVFSLLMMAGVTITISLPRRENVTAGNSLRMLLDHLTTAHATPTKKEMLLYTTVGARVTFRDTNRSGRPPLQVELVLRAGFSIKTYAHRKRVQGAA